MISAFVLMFFWGLFEFFGQHHRTENVLAIANSYGAPVIFMP
jgi:hypothetical protein